MEPVVRRSYVLLTWQLELRSCTLDSDGILDRVEKPTERLREEEDYGSRGTKTDEDDAQTGGKPEQEDAVTGERKRGRPTDEESRPEQLTPSEDLDDESPGTQRLRHVSGGA
ncbi:hypothetical protein NDU88_003003 [Pleurodeles waltl]|uniref:Uncharacterized protein n=1 Tax=Pleurodeles waltl TaxID=8319 RepID=A0AAV7KVA6_PLEWA|nr:hypothetical protein NDU88_003003 [Pleurodeles waltl]